MNILTVSPEMVNPPLRRRELRVHHLLRALSRKHEIRQFSQSRRAGAGQYCWVTPSYLEYRYSEPVPGRIQAFAGDLLLKNPFDPVFSGARLAWLRPTVLTAWIEWANVILVDQPWQFDYCRRRAKHAPVAVLLDSEGAETSAASSRRWRVRAESAARREREAALRADLVVVSSAAQRLSLARLPGADRERLVEVPDGADVEHSRALAAYEKAVLRRRLRLPPRPTAVFAAREAGPAQRQGLDWLRSVSKQMSDFTFVAAGGISPHPTRDGNLLFTGPVEPLTPYLQAADYALFPAANTRAVMLELLEALAAGLPALVFPEALPAVGLRDLEHALVVRKNAAAIAQSLRDLDSDPSLALRLSDSARDFVEAQRDWNHLAGRIDEALHPLLEHKTGRPRRR